MRDRSQLVRKAAVLVASLDPASAQQLLAQMSPEHADRVRSAIDELGPVDVEEQAEVIEEFFRIGPLVPEQSPPGIELDGALAQEVVRDAQARSASAPLTGSPGRPFDFLDHTSFDDLVLLLEREHPQTIAVVVSHLPAPRAAEVLAQLRGSLQAEVARRLVDLDVADPAVVEDIERGLRSTLARRVPRRPRSAGLTTLATILDAADQQTQRGILSNLAAHDRQLAHTLAPPRPLAMSFAEIAQLDDASLLRVLHGVDAQVAVLALAGASPNLMERVLGHLPVAEARTLQYALDHLGPTRLSDVEEAQRELAAVAEQLEHQGYLVRSTRHLSLAV